MERAQPTRPDDRPNRTEHHVVDIAQEPGLRVQVHATADAVIQVRLFPAPVFQFDAEFCHPAQREAIISWLKKYAVRDFAPFPLSLPSGTFQEKVLRFLQGIPCGNALSYKEVAEGVGSPRAARAVGNICRGNPFPLFAPCHRVIHSNGSLGHYSPDPSIKTLLLQFEGFGT